MLVIKANSGITGYQGVLYFNSDKECPDFKKCFRKLSSAKAVAYDLPVGYCWHSWDRASLAELRKQADWLESDDI